MFKLFYGTFTARDHLNSMHGTLKHFLVFVGNSYSPEKKLPGCILGQLHEDEHDLASPVRHVINISAYCSLDLAYKSCFCAYLFIIRPLSY